MLVKSEVTFPFRTHVWHEKLGAGEDKLVTNEHPENLLGPVVLYLPDGPMYFDLPLIFRVTPSRQDLPQGIIRLQPHEPSVVYWTHREHGTFGLRLWHFKLRVSWDR